MKTIRQIDSLSFRGSFEKMFTSENYITEVAKSVGIFEPKLWRDTFKKPLTKSIIEAKILHTSTQTQKSINK